MGWKLLAMLISTTEHLNILRVLILLCVFLFFSNSSISIATHLNRIFLCFFIENAALWYLTCMYCQKLVTHSNQIKFPMWLLVYVTSFLVCPGPSPKICAPALVHKMPKIFIWNASLELFSYHLPWTNFRIQFHLVM